jgi:prophage maintenance system killer protein
MAEDRPGGSELFLEINGSRVEASDRELADWILSFSAGATREQVAALARARAQRIR